MNGMNEITDARINAAEAFLLRCCIPLDKESAYIDVTGALFAAAAHMEHGSELMQLANDIGRLRAVRAQAQEAA